MSSLDLHQVPGLRIRSTSAPVPLTSSWSSAEASTQIYLSSIQEIFGLLLTREPAVTRNWHPSRESQTCLCLTGRSTLHFGSLRLTAARSNTAHCRLIFSAIAPYPSDSFKAKCAWFDTLYICVCVVTFASENLWEILAYWTSNLNEETVSDPFTVW